MVQAHTHHVIRLADELDLPHLVALGEMFWDQAGLDDPYDMDSVVNVFTSLQENGYVLVAEAQGMPVGFIGMIVGDLSFSPTKSATELAFFVWPKHKGLGVSLLREAEAEAKRRGCRYVHMMSLESMRDDAGVDRAGRLYERMGYTPSERVFRKELP